jgi:hypothetical protein
MYYGNYPYRNSPPSHRDYTTAAVLILVLYILGWFPGLVFNLIKLLQALFERGAYERVSGFGCLVALLLVCGIGLPVLVYFALFYLY